MCGGKTKALKKQIPTLPGVLWSHSPSQQASLLWNKLCRCSLSASKEHLHLHFQYSGLTWPRNKCFQTSQPFVYLKWVHVTSNSWASCLHLKSWDWTTIALALLKFNHEISLKQGIKKYIFLFCFFETKSCFVALASLECNYIKQTGFELTETHLPLPSSKGIKGAHHRVWHLAKDVDIDYMQVLLSHFLARRSFKLRATACLCGWGGSSESWGWDLFSNKAKQN